MPSHCLSRNSHMQVSLTLKFSSDVGTITEPKIVIKEEGIS